MARLLLLLGLWGCSRLAFTSLRAYETAPDWAPAPSQAPREAPEEEALSSGLDSRSVIDQIIAEMALDAPEAVQQRIASGQMNFEDFIATSTVMSGSDASALAVPTGYERLVHAMTLEERRDPRQFRGVSGAQRVRRVAEAAQVDLQVAETFLTDFGSIQSFFARVQSSGSQGALKEPMRMAAEYLEQQPRRKRRMHESKNKMLKRAGQELREKKAGISYLLHLVAVRIGWIGSGWLVEVSKLFRWSSFSQRLLVQARKRGFN